MDPRPQPQPTGVTGGNCAVCNEPTKQSCKACLDLGPAGAPLPFYCSKEHQAKHWKGGHQLQCASALQGDGVTLKMTKVGHVNCGHGQDDTSEYRYSATRGLPAGHTLFTKKPLLIIPRPPTKDEMDVFSRVRSDVVEMSNHCDIRTCIGCYKLLIYDWIVSNPLLGPGRTVQGKCVNCGWPLHTSANRFSPSELVRLQTLPSPCEKVHEKECVLLRGLGLTWDKVKGNPNAYWLIGLLRVQGLSAQEQNTFWKFTNTTTAPECVDAVKDVFNWLQGRVPTERVKSILEHMLANMLPIPYFPTAGARLGYVIYAAPKSGRVLPHSCIPNAAVVFDHNSDSLVGHFKTIRPVTKGEQLTITYLTHLDNYRAVDQRAGVYSKLLGTCCKCKRCADPSTEDSTAQFASIDTCLLSLSAILPLNPLATRAAPDPLPATQIQFDLHDTYLPDFEQALEMFARVTPGRVPITGWCLYARSLLRMSQLAEKIRDEHHETIEAVDKIVGQVVEEMAEAWAILVDAQLEYPMDKTFCLDVQKIYANNLVAALGARFGQSDLEGALNFRILGERFADPELVMLEPSERNYFYMVFG